MDNDGVSFGPLAGVLGMYIHSSDRLVSASQQKVPDHIAPPCRATSYVFYLSITPGLRLLLCDPTKHQQTAHDGEFKCATMYY